MNPLVSIIIPTFNRAHIIGETLDSVKNQSYKNWECIIIDDGSVDNSEEIISKFIESDTRFIRIPRPANTPKGAASCRNIGIEKSRGKYIQFLDSDDLISSNKLEVQVVVLENTIPNSIATCKWGGKKPKWSTPRVYQGLSSYKNFPTPLALYKEFANRFTYFPLHVFLIPKELILKSGKWNENLSVNDDGEFFTRLLLQTSKIVFCRNTYVLYRTGGGNRITGTVTTPAGLKSYVESWKLIDKYIFQHTGTKNHIFVQQAKKEMHDRLRAENSDLLSEHTDFFQNKRPHYSYLYHKILSKIQDKFWVKHQNV